MLMLLATTVGRSIKFAICASDDLNDWVEGVLIIENDSASVAQFSFEDIICSHGCPEKIVLDGGSENKGVVHRCWSVTESQRSTLQNFNLGQMGCLRDHGAIVNSHKS